jgi:hypothetical protein
MFGLRVMPGIRIQVGLSVSVVIAGEGIGRIAGAGTERCREARWKDGTGKHDAGARRERGGKAIQ